MARAKAKKDLIKFASNEWQDWFIEQLEDDEGFDKDGKILPKAMGLLRATQRVIGDITYETSVIKAATEQDISATVMVDVKIQTRDTILNEFENAPAIMAAQGVADAGRSNTEMPFGAHAAATAHTRALGRAIKQALFLNTHCAEEIFGTIKPEDCKNLISSANTVSETKIKSILNLLKRLDANEQLSLDKLGGPAEKVLRDGSVSPEIASAFLSLLNEFQNSEVPEKYRK